MARLRTLLAIAVDNDESFVTRTLASAARIDADVSDLDIVVLDDCGSGESSAVLAQQCESLGIGYYRSPRSLGAVRTVNLGLRHATEGGYDFVISSSADVLYPASLLDHLISAFETAPGIASVTAWSNHVSIFSLVNEIPELHLADQPFVDWIAASISGEYRGHVLDVPAGVAFCMMMPTSIVKLVGVMDPIFGRGGGEVTDWSLRALAAGHRNVLAPCGFVYHLPHAPTDAPDNEAIIDMRYPLFRSQVAAFVGGGQVDGLRDTATARIIADAGAQFGYEIGVSWLPREGPTDHVRVLAQADGRVPLVRATFRGFMCEVPTSDDVSASIQRFFHGAEPRQANVFDQGGGTQPSYPGRV